MGNRGDLEISCVARESLGDFLGSMLILLVKGQTKSLQRKWQIKKKRRRFRHAEKPKSKQQRKGAFKYILTVKTKKLRKN